MSPATESLTPGEVVPMPKLPAVVNLAFSLPAVKKNNTSSSAPEEDSARIYVS